MTGHLLQQNWLAARKHRQTALLTRRLEEVGSTNPRRTLARKNGCGDGTLRRR
jgi:hypothetical protein